MSNPDKRRRLYDDNDIFGLDQKPEAFSDLNMGTPPMNPETVELPNYTDLLLSVTKVISNKVCLGQKDMTLFSGEKRKIVSIRNDHVAGSTTSFVNYFIDRKEYNAYVKSSADQNNKKQGIWMTIPPIEGQKINRDFLDSVPEVLVAIAEDFGEASAALPVNPRDENKLRNAIRSHHLFTFTAKIPNRTKWGLKKMFHGLVSKVVNDFMIEVIVNDLSRSGYRTVKSRHTRIIVKLNQLATKTFERKPAARFSSILELFIGEVCCFELLTNNVYRQVEGIHIDIPVIVIHTESNRDMIQMCMNAV